MQCVGGWCFFLIIGLLINCMNDLHDAPEINDDSRQQGERAERDVRTRRVRELSILCDLYADFPIGLLSVSLSVSINPI